MKLEQSFTVAAPVDARLAGAVDVERVAPCLPGARRSPATTTGHLPGDVQRQLGPTTAAYNGTLKMESPRRGRAHGAS